MAFWSELRIRRMSGEDISAGMRLKDIAGWNQVRADWEAFLSLEPQGCFVGEIDHHVVATTTTINYEKRFGWIGMVIVDPEFRRRGIATRMVERAIEYLESVSCLCQKLDATEAGARVYEKLGFHVEYSVERWFRAVPDRVSPISEPAPSSQALTADCLTSILELDRQAFGASRARLLEWYCSNSSPRVVAGKDPSIRGYVVGREGSQAWQMGPLVAVDEQTAEELMHSFLTLLGAVPVIVDVVAHHQGALRLLAEFGFERRRVLYRMYRGENNWPGSPFQTYCLAGFEYG